MRKIPVSTLVKYLPDNVHLHEDGTVSATDESGTAHPLPIEYNENGRPFIRFIHDEPGRDFKLWLTREFYQAFCGVIPEGYEAFHIDGNRANLQATNLGIRPKPRSRSRFRLPTPPKWHPPTD